MDAVRLVFVYNVDASPVALLRDLVQGITTGSTDCHLCDLTFGTLLKDPEWKAFVDGLPVDVEFRLRSTFRRLYPKAADERFPAAFVLRDGEVPHLLISAGEMEKATDLSALRALVGSAVERLELPARVKRREGALTDSAGRD